MTTPRGCYTEWAGAFSLSLSASLRLFSLEYFHLGFVFFFVFFWFSSRSLVFEYANLMLEGDLSLKEERHGYRIFNNFLVVKIVSLVKSGSK